MGLFSDDFQATSPGLDDEAARQKRFTDALAAIQGRNPMGDAFAQGQTGLVNQLQQTASGQGPSVAGDMLKTAQNNNLAQAMAMAASSRGNVNPALVQRNAMNAAANANQTSAGQAATLKDQEALNAEGQLGTVLNQGRGQNLQAQGESDQAALGYEGLGLNAAQDELNAKMQAQQVNAGISSGNQANTTKLIGGLMSGVGSGAAMALMAHGGVVPGRAKLPGDNLRNDTVPTVLSPGEEVIPRSAVSRGPDAIKAFAAKLQEGKSKAASEPVTFGHVIAAQRSLHARLSALEARKGK